MAEKIVSPGVFTNELDLSFLPAGVANIGAAFVGPLQKGPAFVPIVLTNFEQFKSYYGDLNESYYIPYAVRNYLKNASQVTVVRVVSEGGYATNGLSIISGSSIIGLLLPTTQVGFSNGADFAKTTGAAVTAGTASLVVSGSNVTAESASVSFTSTDTNYILKVLGQSAKGAKKAYAYVYMEQYAKSQTSKNFVINSGSLSASIDLSGASTNYGKFRPGATPWITSQLIGTGASKSTQRLFRVLTQGDGDLFNRTFKVSIINTNLAGNVPGSDYGNFTLLVRDYNDTDKRPNVLETYSNLNLDPDSPNYVARRIGDRYYEVVASSGFGAEVVAKGEYNNISKLIRVEMNTQVANKATDAGLNPYGFESVLDTVVVPGCTMPTASLVTVNPEIEGDYSERAYYGWHYDGTNDNANYLKPVPNGATVGSNVLFNLDECAISVDYGTARSANSALTAGQVISGSTLRGLDVSTIAKFNVPFQNGFDGDDPAVPLNTGANITDTNTVGMNCATATSSGSVAYFKALNAMSNAETFDINLLSMPGINLNDHKIICDKAVDVATTRGDAFVILDPVKQGTTVGTAIEGVEGSLVDSNYAAAYWPWVKILDINRNKPVWVPASAVLPGVIARSDAAAFEWFAPAGLNRGGIPDALEVEAKLSVSQRDALYDARINPLASFPAQGVCVWGQKTLQTKASALDRVNVRRLMITLKKYIASSTRYLVFENNTVETRQKFINIVTPYLENVKARQGLYAFRVVMDESNNTPDVIDRNQLYGQIFIQPTKTAEFIVLDFNILPTGATFDNA